MLFTVCYISRWSFFNRSWVSIAYILSSLPCRFVIPRKKDRLEIGFYSGFGENQEVLYLPRISCLSQSDLMKIGMRRPPLAVFIRDENRERNTINLESSDTKGIDLLSRFRLLSLTTICFFILISRRYLGVPLLLLGLEWKKRDDKQTRDFRDCCRDAVILFPFAWQESTYSHLV